MFVVVKYAIPLFLPCVVRTVFIGFKQKSNMNINFKAWIIGVLLVYRFFPFATVAGWCLCLAFYVIAVYSLFVEVIRKTVLNNLNFERNLAFCCEDCLGSAF